MNDEAELLEVVCNRCGSGDEIGSCDWGEIQVENKLGNRL